MFEKTLSDVIKGIRASKRDSSKYISQCIAEIRTELTSADMFVKANALEKLTFLQMMGYSMAFASFQTTEVMSSPRFAHKRIGYLAAVRVYVGWHWLALIWIAQTSTILLLHTHTHRAKALRKIPKKLFWRSIY
jgi:Adaptin N terminal region